MGKSSEGMIGGWGTSVRCVMISLIAQDTRTWKLQLCRLEHIEPGWAPSPGLSPRIATWFRLQYRETGENISERLCYV